VRDDLSQLGFSVSLSSRPSGWRRHFEKKKDCAMKTIRRFLADESGATAIEYGLIAAGISLAIISVINGLGTRLNSKFTSINSSLK
jgi:pilus assembly protein Flp/PilA